jgi:hypothetical protein
MTMPRRTYNTIAVELVEYADRVADHFESTGYRVRVEHVELGRPFTPTLVCDRKPTTVLIDVVTRLDHGRVEAWVRYARSCGKDTRVAICVPHTVALSNSEVGKLSASGVGLYTVMADSVVEQCLPADLALNVALPEPRSLSKEVKTKLGSAYEKFNRQQWREGFEDACLALEVEARRYLAKWSRTGRIRILGKKGVPGTLTTQEINKLTMGQLAVTFDRIQAQNHTDSLVAKALRRINKDRVGVVHHKGRAVVEKRLRTNVGQHMWVIVAALKEMV